MKKVLFVLSLMAFLFPTIAGAQTKTANHEVITEIACESYTWMNGETYTSDTVVFMISNDTLYVLDLEIHHGGSYTASVSAGCKYVWGDSTYMESTVATHTFADRFGCDSTVTLTLTIEDTGRFAYDTTVCKKYTWRGKTFTADTLCVDTVHANPTSGTCAQLHTLNLHILTPTQGTTSDTTVSGCGFASFGNGSNRITARATMDTSRIITITADGQCVDNVLNIHLIIYDAKYTRIDTTSCGPFVFLGTTYNESKEDSIKVGKSTEGCDSSVALFLTVYEDLSVHILGDLDLLPGGSTTLSGECDHDDATLTWSYDGQTSTDPSITLSNLQENTDVALTATSADQNCSRTAYVTVMVSPYVTGINEASENDIQLYPNPTSSVLNIVSPKAVESVVVYNMAGQKIEALNVESEQISLNLAHYNNGIYMLSMRMSDGSVVNQKVAVKK